MPNIPKFDDVFKSDLTKGLAIGLALAAIVPLAVPALAQAARPLLRSAVKSGILLLELGREVVAEAGENLEDIVAEVRSELAERHQDDVGATIVEAVAEADPSSVGE